VMWRALALIVGLLHDAIDNDDALGSRPVHLGYNTRGRAA
jgi:hypothetical protein